MKLIQKEVEIGLTNHKKIISRISLNEISDKLNSSFQRIHRGSIINLNYLDKVTQDAVLVSNYNIPIGKKYKEDLMKKMDLPQKFNFQNIITAFRTFFVTEMLISLTLPTV